MLAVRSSRGAKDARSEATAGKSLSRRETNHHGGKVKMSNLPATLRQEAVSLRDYLGSKDVMPQISSALPKWLSPDRFFRVVFGAILRNPKLVECTRESILQSVMFCAQLGVEPILGRAYLIPYENSKYVKGEWVKIPECQAQIGYQGLVDLAGDPTPSPTFGARTSTKTTSSISRMAWTAA